MSGRIDLRSDTTTRPTAAMFEAMAHAAVGDDAWGEDPTVQRLERTAAGKLGKEAALYVPSGTMGNACALMAHVGEGDAVFFEERAHLFGGAAAPAGPFPARRLIRCRPSWGCPIRGSSRRP